MIITRAVLRRLGRFNVQLGTGAKIPAGEDTDLVFELDGKNWTVFGE
jgi:hypothetical protein